jgi:hypothetical protein
VHFDGLRHVRIRGTDRSQGREASSGKGCHISAFLSALGRGRKAAAAPVAPSSEIKVNSKNSNLAWSQARNQI